jgi:hypothetical protein
MFISGQLHVQDARHLLTFTQCSKHKEAQPLFGGSLANKFDSFGFPWF